MAGHPTAIATGGERIDVFSVGTDGRVQQKYFFDGWTPAGEFWGDLGGTMMGPITAVAGGSGTIHLLALGTCKRPL